MRKIFYTIVCLFIFGVSFANTNINVGMYAPMYGRVYNCGFDMYGYPRPCTSYGIHYYQPVYYYQLPYQPIPYTKKRIHHKRIRGI